jgi:hypothetical protein
LAKGIIRPAGSKGRPSKTSAAVPGRFLADSGMAGLECASLETCRSFGVQ